MGKAFNPAEWYWLADDGRVYSATAQNIVTTSDSGYISFTAGSSSPATPWPRDDAGAQTNAALLDVIGLYGLSLSPQAALVAYAAAKRYDKEIAGINVGGVQVLTDDRSKMMIMGARVKAAADSAFTTPWVGADGTITTLNATQIIAVSDAVLAWVAACFGTFATVVAGVAGNTITTRDQVDAAFA